MAILSSLLTAVFLILVAASAAVTISMVVLGLADLAFSKKNEEPVAAEVTESEGNEIDPRLLPEATSMRAVGRMVLLVACSLILGALLAVAWKQGGGSIQSTSTEATTKA